MNYPRKGKKKAAREARTSVSVLCRKTPTDEEFLITQRPPTGLFMIIVVSVQHITGTCTAQYRYVYSAVPVRVQRSIGTCTAQYRYVYSAVSVRVQRSIGTCTAQYR